MWSSEGIVLIGLEFQKAKQPVLWSEGLTESSEAVTFFMFNPPQNDTKSFSDDTTYCSSLLLLSNMSANKSRAQEPNMVMVPIRQQQRSILCWCGSVRWDNEVDDAGCRSQGRRLRVRADRHKPLSQIHEYDFLDNLPAQLLVTVTLPCFCWLSLRFADRQTDRLRMYQ